MDTFFYDTIKQLPRDNGGQPLGNVEEKEFMFKSPSTSAKGSEHCIEDSYIIQQKEFMDDDVKSQYQLNRESQKGPALDIDDNISQCHFGYGSWSPKIILSRRNSILGDHHNLERLSPPPMQIPKSKTYDEPQTDYRLVSAGSSMPFNIDDFLVNTNPLSAPEHIMTSTQRPLQYPWNGYSMALAQDENQEHNEPPPLFLQNEHVE